MEDGGPRIAPIGPEIVHACMPVREVLIHDTWHVSGLHLAVKPEFGDVR